jgi:TrmH family RNA methyltransferase
MLSKNKIKYLSSLSDKKARLETLSFLVEGEKMVFELINSGFKVISLLYTQKMGALIKSLPLSSETELIEISEEEASKISTQKSPQGIFALASIPEEFYSKDFSVDNELTLALHDVQDPGNLGTIVRTADWFGIKQIICSRNTVDILNPKVLQSTMGAVFRVKIFYTDLLDRIKKIKKESPEIPIMAAILEGENLYKNTLPTKGILMMGNESKGLSDELIELSTHKITIPRFGNSANSSESLNVSVATAIIMAELRRRGLEKAV